MKFEEEKWRKKGVLSEVLRERLKREREPHEKSVGLKQIRQTILIGQIWWKIRRGRKTLKPEFDYC